MTKILYIPSGTYITLFDRSGKYTLDTVEKMAKAYPRIYKTPLDIIDVLTAHSFIGSTFCKRNGLPIGFNLLKSEFEVIYD